MKSTDKKNWRDELSYQEIVSLDDFREVLTAAISEDCCMLCGGDRVTRDGLCIGCGLQLTGKDKEISLFFLHNVKVGISVDIPEKNWGKEQ